MRNLLITMGAPGSGKSSWIKDNGLEKYTIAPDNLRMLVSQPMYNIDGKMAISQNNDKYVWELLDKLLEDRMKKGQFTVIDATHTREKYLKRYKKLAEEYRYRLYVKKFDVSENELIKRNNEREEHKQIPEEAIKLHVSRMQSVEIPNSYKQIENVNEINEFIRYDVSNKKTYFIGDIHGCMEQLQQFLVEHYKVDPEVHYVFCGDYIDRGPESGKVINKLIELQNNGNCTFLEGNHEIWLWKWANDDMETIRSREFILRTKQQLDGIVDKRDARQFYRKLRTFYTAKTYSRKYFACHGGVPTPYPDFIATEQLINGVGDYEEVDKVHKSWQTQIEKFPLEKHIQVHGHRNVQNSILTDGTSINLDGHVEFGGELRVMCVTENEHQYYSYKNNSYIPKPAGEVVESGSRFTGISEIDKLRSSKFVKEVAYGDISSFNFTHQAFTKRKWNDETIKARGLFVNTKTNKVVARSYDKFFNLGEREETSEFHLSKNLKFPVKAYYKYNGFLGIVGYDESTDKVLYCSKSTVGGEFAVIAKDVLDGLSVTEDKLKEIVKTHNCSIVLEIIDPVKDPHIIKYEKPEAYILDVIKNDFNFERVDIDSSIILGIPNKEIAGNFSNYKELKEMIEYTQKNHKSEGLVFEDSLGFMFKLKTDFYNKWKRLRGVKDKVHRQGFRITDFAFDPDTMAFLNFCKSKDPEVIKSKDIISLREMYLENTEKHSPKEELVYTWGQ